jgi:alpha-N-arabinofuranosidase
MKRLILTAVTRERTLLFPKLLLYSLCLLPTAAWSQASAISATINVAKTGAPISQNIYGQFLEHGGDIVNSGIWSEMLVDRKFFYPVTTVAPTPPAAIGNAAGNLRFENLSKRWWAPVGGDSFVTMDSKAPYTGDQSPAVRLSMAEPHGLRQAGILVRKKKTYTGRILLAGTPGTVVRVPLIVDSSATGYQAITIHTLSQGYRSYSLRVSANADSDNATLEITGTGKGEFHVDAVSLMPADNIDGFRPEIIAVLKQLRFGVLRFPGGNFVSSYEWRYGMGGIDKRPPIFDPVWHALQSNDVGTDEFLTLCKLLGVEPYITVNAGFGDAWLARELVEYTNGPATTPMGKWRAQNGHPAPYNVKLWATGNEPWGDYQMGAMALPQFEMKHNFFAKEMKKIQ